MNQRGYSSLYNWCITQFNVSAGSEAVFTLPDNLSQDKFDLSIISGIIGVIAPTVGGVCVIRKDVDKFGSDLRSLLEFVLFTKYVAEVLPNGEKNTVIRVFNQTPNVYIIKNTMDVDIIVSPFIDVLNQPFSAGR